MAMRFTLHKPCRLLQPPAARRPNIGKIITRNLSSRKKKHYTRVTVSFSLSLYALMFNLFPNSRTVFVVLRSTEQSSPWTRPANHIHITVLYCIASSRGNLHKIILVRLQIKRLGVDGVLRRECIINNYNRDGKRSYNPRIIRRRPRGRDIGPQA